MTEKLQSDHFWEIQCSGGNVLENLWPLERELNGKSGNYIKNLEVMTLAGPRKVTALKKDAQKYWLKIVGFRRPP
jgi:hypothetical protein